MAQNVVELPRIGGEVTFVNTEFVVGTQLYYKADDKVPSRLLIYISSMENIAIEASESVTPQYLADLNQHIANSINDRCPPVEETPPEETLLGGGRIR